MNSSAADPKAREEGAPRKKRRTVWLVREPSRTDDALCIAGLILFALGLAFVLLQAFAPEAAAWLRWPLPCAFYSLLHFPCLGCGATRALRALAGGRLRESFLWHPAVPFFALQAVIFLLSQALGRLTHGKRRMLTFNDRYIYALLAVILLQWIVKLLIGWQP